MTKNKIIPAYTIKFTDPTSKTEYYYTFNSRKNFLLVKNYIEDPNSYDEKNKKRVEKVFNSIYKKVKSNTVYYQNPQYVFDPSDITQPTQNIHKLTYDKYKYISISKYYKYKDFIKPNLQKNGVKRGEPTGKKKFKILKDISNLALEIDIVQDFIIKNFNSINELLKSQSLPTINDSYLKIVSGYRSQEYQEQLRSSSRKSRHVHDAAADLMFADASVNSKKVLFLIFIFLVDNKIIKPGWIQCYPESTKTLHVHYDFSNRNKIPSKTIEEHDNVISNGKYLKFYKSLDKTINNDKKESSVISDIFNVYDKRVKKAKKTPIRQVKVNYDISYFREKFKQNSDKIEFGEISFDESKNL
jgi:hypothetical protein